MLAGGDGGEGWGGSCCNGLFGLEGSRPRLPFKLSVRTTGGRRQTSTEGSPSRLGHPQGNKYRPRSLIFLNTHVAARSIHFKGTLKTPGIPVFHAPRQHWLKAQVPYHDESLLCSTEAFPRCFT